MQRFTDSKIQAMILICLSFFVSSCGTDGMTDNFFGKKTNELPVASAGAWKTINDNDYFRYEMKSPSGALDILVPYLAFIDVINFNKVSVMKYDEYEWKFLGPTNAVSPENASYLSFLIYRHDPYIAYCDGSNENRLTVLRFNGEQWTNMGQQHISPGKASYSAIAIDNTIEMFAAFCDGTDNDRTAVMRYYAGIWQRLGDKVSTGSSSNVTLAVYDGVPYVAYVDKAAGGKIRAHKYNGLSAKWESIGNTWVAGDYSNYPSIKVSDGTPYLAFTDGPNDSRAAVMKYNGTAWENVGKPWVSAGPSTYTDLFIFNGTPYLTFCDHTSGQRAAAVKFDGTWKNIGYDMPSPDKASDMFIRVSDHAMPYAGYIDKTDKNKLVFRRFE